MQDAIFYQIFPDRFSNGDKSNDPPNVQAWGAPPTQYGFQGGDLRGITQHLDYLDDLGVNAIYLNPIFLSPSNHRFNTSDYYNIDPRLGSLKDFQIFVDKAHAHKIRIVLDGVFNHCSRGFFAFADVLENGLHSSYVDWFHIKKFPLRAYQPGKSRQYLSWWGYKSMPKFNTQNPVVRRYILDVASYWIHLGADGWRLDVPNEIDDDTFWAEFRQVVKKTNPEACLIGEIWTIDPRWVGDEHFDGLMNYPLRAAVLGLLLEPGMKHSGPQIKPLTMNDFVQQIENLLKVYPRDNVFCMYNLLGSHDTERLRTLMGNHLPKLKLAYAILYAFPGAPSMYYGDEIGMMGGRDPDCRGAFNWQPETWHPDLLAWIKTLIAIRKNNEPLRRGDYTSLLLDNKNNCYAFARSLANKQMVIALNASSKAQELLIPTRNINLEHASLLHNLLDQNSSDEINLQISEQGIHLRLPEWGIAWLG